MKRILLAVLLLVSFVACGQVTRSVNEVSEKTFAQNVQPRNTPQDCGEMNFHFLITSDEQKSLVVRRIDVFLDEKAFSEENLKFLFSRLSNKYAEATFLIVIVNTNWNQLPLPLNSDNCPGIGLTNQPARPDEYYYYQAKFYRRNDNEFFTYTPTLKTGKFKDVIMKGNKIYRNGQWQEN